MNLDFSEEQLVLRDTVRLLPARRDTLSAVTRRAAEAIER